MEIDHFLLFNSPLVSFTLLFCTIYAAAYLILFKNWGSKRSDACSCFISMAHGTPAVIMAIKSLKNQSLSSELSFVAKNTAFQDLVIDYSTGYFIVDFLHYLIFIPSDVIFKVHHLVTLYALLTCRYVVNHGAFSILCLLILAEITSPCQNTWSLARYRKVDVPLAARYHEFLSPIFYAYYSVVRGILGPLFAYKMGLVFAGGAADGLIPKWAWISWLVITVCLIAVSMLWILNHWIDLCRRKATESKKVSQRRLQ